MSSGKWLADWTQSQFDVLESGVLLAQHRLLETGLFSDENLIRLFDSHPPECLHVNTMGENAGVMEWQEGDRNGVSAEELLATLKRGRLWVNLRNMLDHHRDFADAINGIYAELEAGNRKFKATNRSANLLISSPRALVYYHMDIPVNMLWHLRGEKRVWVYPHFDERFVEREVREMVCCGEYTEDIPYDESFDQFALTFDVKPGQLLTWPQHTPHRVTNLDGLNVSLSTEHRNPVATRRNNVIMANRWLRKTFQMDPRSSSPDGLTAHLKQALMRSIRFCSKFRKTDEGSGLVYPVTFKVDPTAPLGFTPLDSTEREHDAESAPMMAM